MNRRRANDFVRDLGGKCGQLPHDWLERFYRSDRATSLRIGRRLLIANGKRTLARGRCPNSLRGPHILSIPAGAAFGTGEHATTEMSLRLLEEVTRLRAADWRMFDAGTGSGILALAGRLLGAGEILAIDHDPLAIRTAKQNARTNGIRGVKFVLADLDRRLFGKFDVITANLHSELLATVLPRFRRCLVKGGSLVLSGVLRSQEDQLVTSLGAAGFRSEKIRRRGKWIALLAVKRDLSQNVSSLQTG